MSGSPPLPPRRNPDSSDRGHGSYGSIGQEVFGGSQRTHPEQLEQMRGPLLQPYQQGPQPPISYSVYQMESIAPSQRQYPQLQQRPQIQPEQHQTYGPQPSGSIPMPPMTEVQGYSSPKAQRKTKGHVASACVPCKRAHLRCDAQRPCSRCLTNGKDDACVDVQHKKRGRPRLRDEREPRYEGMGPSYPGPDSMRRPVSMYSAGDMTVAMPFSDLQRSSSYRVLKSQGGGDSMGGPLSGRYMDRPLADPSVYGGSIPQTPRMLSMTEPACAYLTMDMQFVKATHAFGETVGIQPLTGRRLQDVLGMNDRDKVFRLQKTFEDERREREPNYLPPIYPKYEEDRVIQSVGFGPEEVNSFRTDRTEYFTFQGPDGQQRAFQVRLGLAKRESTYFIISSVQVPATPQTYHQPSSSPYSRESFSRDSQYGFQTPQSYSQPSVSPFMSSPASFGDPRESMNYRGPGPLVPSIPSATVNAPFPQAQRSDFAQGQAPYQPPRNEASQQPQHDLQLPPIRDQGPSAESRYRDDRSGRVAIGGLLAKPDPSRRGQ